jgi:hypothetical protein
MAKFTLFESPLPGDEIPPPNPPPPRKPGDDLLIIERVLVARLPGASLIPVVPR